MRQKVIPEAKIVLVGDVAIGKSSVSTQYVHSVFDEKMQSTLGAAYMQKIQEVNGKSIKMKIWDTAGQEKYRAIAKLYYKDSQVAILMYDVTRRQTFLNLKAWIQELKKHAPKNIIFIVVGNKVDLLQSNNSELLQQEITKQMEAKQFAESINATFFQLTAKDKEAVDQLFKHAALNALQIVKSTLSTKQSNLKSSTKLSKSSIIKDQSEWSKKKCCEN